MQVESSESQPRTKENDSATGGGCRRPLQREVMQSAYRHLPLVLGLPITPAHLTFSISRNAVPPQLSGRSNPCLREGEGGKEGGESWGFHPRKKEPAQCGGSGGGYCVS